MFSVYGISPMVLLKGYEHEGKANQQIVCLEVVFPNTFGPPVAGILMFDVEFISHTKLHY